MAIVTKNISDWYYNVNGGNWQKGSGKNISIGTTNSDSTYRGYITFNLSDILATYPLNSITFSFKRYDSYGTIRWDIGLRSSTPGKTFSESDFS